MLLYCAIAKEEEEKESRRQSRLLSATEAHQFSPQLVGMLLCLFVCNHLLVFDGDQRKRVVPRKKKKKDHQSEGERMSR